MSKMAAALAWAERGFRVFPLVENDKEPIGGVSPPRDATTDPDAIRVWWTDPVTRMERGYNIGCLTTDYVVCDVDTKGGKPGLRTFAEWGGDWNTLVVQTPSNGYHCYYVGPDSSMAYPSGVHAGLDIRSHNGYVVAPGSTINGVAYRVVNDAPMAWVPLKLEAFLRPPSNRIARDFSCELDAATSVAVAREWLVHSAPVAVEGQGGDATTYAVAAKLVRDFALTEDTAYELLCRHWNDRCMPPWDAGELMQKVENAWNYATGDVGAALPSTLLGTINAPAPPPSEGAVFVQAAKWGNARDVAALPQRPWLIKRLLMRGEVTVMPAAGSAGKSVLAVIIAAHGAVGRDFGPYRIPKPFRSVIVNAEDDVDEQTRRLAAVCVAYGLPFEEVRHSIMFVDSDMLQVTLAASTRGVVEANMDHVNALAELVAPPDVGLLVLDPLVDIHACDEQDNPEMRFVMSLIKRIARATSTAALVPHHTSKGGTNAGHKGGNVDISRGASAITNSARIVVTLFNCTDQDRAVYDIPEQDRHLYVRLDDAKMNLSLASSNSVWFKREGFKLYNGDEVGVLKLYPMRTNDDATRKAIAVVCMQAIQAAGSGSISMKAAVVALQAFDPLYAKLPDHDLRKKIEMALRVPVEIEEGVVQCYRETSADGKDKVVVRML